MKEQTNTPVKKHHWLFAAQMVFVKVDESGQPTGDGAALLLNGMLLTDEKQIKHRDLARAQMQAVANLNERFKGERIQIVDCVFTSGFSHLGYMTQEEYAVNPEGQVLVKTEVDVAPKKSHLSVMPKEGDPVSGD